MIDCETNERLTVSVERDAAPYLLVPLEQLPEVTRVLDAHRVVYSVAEDAVGLDGEPFIAIIDFSRNSDASRLQTLLDAAA